jgi:hypothetical protein
MVSAEEIRLRTALEYLRKKVAEGERIIEEQSHLIADMEVRGVKTTASQAVLDTFRRTQALFIDDLHRVEEELAAFEHNN